jgi:FMN reductase
MTSMGNDSVFRSEEDGTTARQLAVISAGISEPSATRMLADRIAQQSLDLLKESGASASVAVVELAPLAVDIAQATVSGFPSEALKSAIGRIARADAVIAATPVYKAGISGLFKSFVDLLDNDLLIAKPMLLAATAGSGRHALVADEHLRSLFAYMRAMTVPTSVFAAPEDWGAPELGQRIRRAAAELTWLVEAGIEQRIADRSWSGYQHQFAGNAARAQQSAEDINFDSPLMRLAAGGQSAAVPSDSHSA